MPFRVANLTSIKDKIRDQNVRTMPIITPLSLQRRWWRLALPGGGLRVDGGPGMTNE